MSDNKKYRDASYKDWLKRRNQLNNEVMSYKRHQWELLKKYSLLLLCISTFLYLIFGAGL